MMRILIIKTAIIGIGIALLTACHSKPKTSPSHEGEVLANIKTMQVPGGWGYRIYMDTTLYITQPFIPLIKGKRPFPTEDAARRTAQRVIDNIREKNSMSLDSADLVNLGLLH